MAYVFTQDLETGIGAVDSQHKQLFDAMNHLADACSQGKGRVEIEKTLKFLNDYIIKHFNDEEKILTKCKYPDLTTHKRYHETFKKTVRDIMDEYQKNGGTIVLVGKINSVVGMWLMQHIKGDDKKYAGYIKENSLSV